ncbi:malto-oligosyltrehalose synthase [Knoellia sp. Soil729]|uniref:malto-oligosyltrehalose synthase n=1 Tax=Knoellia sp. Soil729 TaxID=1736394 RepID=UPI0006FB9399|nr:malto-oligosyltrehalose synthase [Knoellia sp. Soil729]KRE43541.1 maltooligosyl trehalose synthase [Knoellia sp. Soil729]
MPSAPVVVGPSGRAVPTSTYRLQIHGGFGFDAAAEQAAYIASLGVSHLYLSPILQPAPGSTHGYDVTDHSSLNAEAGGRKAFDRLVAEAHECGLGIIVDVVPNHVTVPDATHLNPALWTLLKAGRDAATASWFDIDWSAHDGKVLMPVLGASLEDVLSQGELSLARDGGAAGDEAVLRYYDHEYPVAAGTEHLPLADLVAAQHYRLANWRAGADELNYRRFFDVTSLLAVRVEDPEVFDATHELLLSLFHEGAIDGFRIDHPDGLADPQGYLDRLAEATGGAWVVAEKILEGEEQLPESWRCAGTTGYDTLLRVQQALTSSAGDEVLDRLWAEHAAQGRASLDDVVTESKELVVATVQAAEVNRLMGLVTSACPQEEPGGLRAALEALLVSMDRYRAYLVPGQSQDRDQLAVLAAAAERAHGLLDPANHPRLETILGLARGEVAPGMDRDVVDEFMVRFQQTCGPVMAKGIEDTAFYRWFRLSGANEVGGHPSHLSIGADAFHDFESRQLAAWPTTMTTLTTHDTKRSEDVRARLMTLAESAQEWAEWVHEASDLGAAHRSSLVDPATEYLVWQTVLGAWAIVPDRIETYVLKAVREAKDHTAWVDGDADYEAAVVGFSRAVVADAAVARHIETWLSLHAASVRANVLGQKLLQLVAVGVPDVYQGAELQVLTLVDPDNRGAVDYAERAERLARLDAGERARDLDDEKLWVTTTALRLRREHPQWFVGDDASYERLESSTPHAVALTRGRTGAAYRDVRSVAPSSQTHPSREVAPGGVVAVVTREADRLAAAGGFGEATVRLPEGRWRNLLCDTRADTFEGDASLADVLVDLPVALMVRES